MRLLLLTLATVLTLPASVAARDNFLVIVADDVGVDAINVYSRDDLYGHDGEGAAPGPTPTIDQLASEGVLFRHAYTNPVCAPTRAAMLTGRHGFRTLIGVPEAAVLDVGETIIPELLSATHHTAAIGKWHLGPAANVDHPIDSGFDYYAGGLGGGVGDYFSWNKTTNSTSTTGSTQTGYTTYATIDAANEAIAKIAEYGEDPWFIWLAFNASHTPFHVPPSELTTITVDAGSDNATKFKAGVEAMDTEIERLLASIPQSIRDDTTVIFIGDNGTPSGASESPFESGHAKGSVYEGGINVPFIVNGPRIEPADEGSESLALVGSVDLFATIAEIAGVAAAAEDSLSLLPYFANPSRPTLLVRPYIYEERFEPNGAGPYSDERRAIRDATYKLIWRDGQYEELFNLDDDPFETANLLPTEDLTAEELVAYETLVEAMDDVEAGGDVACPTMPDAGCTTGFAKSVFKWKVKDGHGDRLSAKLAKGPALAQSDFGNPLADGGTAYGICTYDDAGVLVAQLRATRGGDECTGETPCWKTLGGDPPDGKGYKYRDSDLTSQGLQKAKFQGGDAGKSKIQIKGRDEGLPDAVPMALLASSSVTIQLRGSDTTQCLSATLTDIKRQEADQFTAK